MQNTFDVLINSYIETKIGIADDFISRELAEHLVDNLTLLYRDKQMLAAGTGNNSAVVHNKLFRNDVIYWLDRSHNNLYENDFFDLMDKFVSHLNESCYAGITDYEFHYALYETGSFYKKHLDQFQTDQSRQFSMIIYLNLNWKQEDGGELLVYCDQEEKHISPVSGKGVFFKSSELEHEVLMAHKPRMSITGWLKK